MEEFPVARIETGYKYPWRHVTASWDVPEHITNEGLLNLLVTKKMAVLEGACWHECSLGECRPTGPGQTLPALLRRIRDRDGGKLVVLQGQWMVETLIEQPGKPRTVYIDGTFFFEQSEVAPDHVICCP